MSPTSRRLMLHIAVLVSLCLVRAAASECPTFSGKVVGVSDGDTMRVLRDRTEVKVRLHGVDCPESGQPYGAKAKQFTSGLAFGKVVVVKVLDRDRYGRAVGLVTLPDKRSLNQELVRAGMAWWYRQYAPDDKTLQELESEARKAKRGLWADPNPVPPWEWRKQ